MKIGDYVRVIVDGRIGEIVQFGKADEVLLIFIGGLMEWFDGGDIKPE